LCWNCNLALGHVRESHSILEGMLDYIS
jgi:hypothetical protein